MKRLSWYGYTAEVDEPIIRNWYARAEDWGCSCGDCRNFLALARGRKLPEELLDLLDRLSIPPEKATYVCALYQDESWREKGLLYELCWRIAGTILDRPAGEDNGPDWGPLVKGHWGGVMLGHDSYPVKPEFPAPHFDLTCTMYLPWVLDEPIDGPKEEES